MKTQCRTRFICMYQDVFRVLPSCCKRTKLGNYSKMQHYRPVCPNRGRRLASFGPHLCGLKRANVGDFWRFWAPFSRDFITGAVISGLSVGLRWGGCAWAGSKAASVCLPELREPDRSSGRQLHSPPLNVGRVCHTIAGSCLKSALKKNLRKAEYSPVVSDKGL